MKPAIALPLIALPFGLFAAGAAERTSFKFDFGSAPVASGYLQVTPTNLYLVEAGFGFEPGASVVAVDRGGPDPLRRDFCTSGKPFYFSIALPEGNYLITATFGDLDGESTNTVKAELRRLMLENVRTDKGRFTTRTFAVNIRTPKIPGGATVSLKPRERTSEFAAWDDKLTIEFNGSRPCLCALEISPADARPTVYILGDSTVCDQPTEPWNSWGQMLPRFFTSDVVIANHAESGESLRSSLGAKRLDKVLSAMKPGDYLFVQFGHNDMKDRATNALAVYKSNLKLFASETRKKQGIPVLVTSMEREAGTNHPTLGEYPATVREVAREDGVELIDLNAMSLVLYHALGPARLGKAFQDTTHHNNYGSYELAQCVVQGIRQSQLPLQNFIVKEFTGFDPGHPDPPELFAMPASPGPPGSKPLGD